MLEWVAQRDCGVIISNTQNLTGCHPEQLNHKEASALKLVLL